MHALASSRIEPVPSVEAPESAIGVMPGTRFGRYAVVRLLAMGGMSELYVAKVVDGTAHERAGPAALKRMLPHLAWDPDFVRMFLDEVHVSAGLAHPNIVRILDYGIGDGGHFFAMEYLHGHNLREILRGWPGPEPMPLSVALGIVIEVAAGLAYAHGFIDGQGRPTPVIHRDVSPANILVTYDGIVKLVDFGIAKVAAQTRQTRAGMIKGKIGYMSPEQCRGDAIDLRSDVFGLGILLYELTVHRRAFFADNDYGVMNRIVEGRFDRPSAVRPNYPAALERIIERALAVDPAHRYVSAEAFADELRRFVERMHIDVGVAPRCQFMAAQYGQPPLPSLELPERPVVAGRLPVSATPARMVTLVPLGLVLVVLGFVLGGLRMAGDGDVPETSVPAAARGEPESAASAHRAPTPEVEAPEVEAPEVLEAPEVEAPEVLEAPEVEADRPSPRRPKRRRHRTKSTSDARPSAQRSDGERGLLPPSWH